MRKINSNDNDFFKKYTEKIDNQEKNQTGKRKKSNFLKIRFTRRNFLLVLIPAILIILFLAVGVFAKTGIVYIPVFSQIFYRVPQPIRLIEKIDPAEYSSLIPKYGFNEETKIFHLEFTEEEATFIVRQSIANNPNANFTKTAQVVFEDGQVEFFGLMLEPVKTNLTVTVKLDYADKFKYRISRLRIGNLNLPSFIVDWLVKFYGNQAVKGKMKELGIDPNKIDFSKSNIKLNNLQVDDGKFILDFFVDTDKIKENLEQFNRSLEQRAPEQTSTTTP